jgi:hypothetical protein
MDFGAVADGTNHPLSEIYSSLTAAQADFPFATSLANSRDRVALQKCFDLAKNNDSLHLGKNVYIPAGNYYLDAMLRIDTVYGMTVRGDGLATVLSWHGGAVTEAALKIILSELCTFKHFLLSIGDNSHPPRGIWLTNRTGPSDGIVSTHAIFRHVRIVGTFVYSVDVAYDVAAGAGDNNNDLHVFEHCEIAQYDTAGVHVNGGQSRFLRFYCTDFVALSSTSTYGIWCEYGAYLHCDKCNFQSNNIDLRLDQFFPGRLFERAQQRREFTPAPGHQLRRRPRRYRSGRGHRLPALPAAPERRIHPRLQPQWPAHHSG